MMFLDKFRNFLYELSFVELKQDQGIDLWYYLIKILRFYKISESLEIKSVDPIYPTKSAL